MVGYEACFIVFYVLLYKHSFYLYIYRFGIMSELEQQKIRLEQKKNRLIAEETKIRLKERKMRTRKLIELGGLITKAELDHFDVGTLYGALLSLADAAKQNNNMIKVY